MGSSESKTLPPPTPVKKEEFKRIWAQTTTIKWTAEETDHLKASILGRHSDSNGKPIKPKLLVFGPSGAGKSSLCNGIVSALEGKKNVSSYFAVASIGGTFTKGFHGKKFNDMWLLDMGGIYESTSISDQNIRDIASGNIPFYAKLTDNLEVKDREEMMVPPPGKNDVACVLIVLGLGMDIPVQIKRQIHCIMELAGNGVISYRLILTHVDVCDEEFSNPRSLPSVLDSRAVQEGVMEMSKQSGVPAAFISVVRNYANEPETDFHTNLLILHALEKVVSAAHEQIEKKADLEKMKRELYDDDDD